MCEDGLLLNDSLCDGVGLGAAYEFEDNNVGREMPLSDKLELGGESPVVEPSDDRLK